MFFLLLLLLLPLGASARVTRTPDTNVVQVEFSFSENHVTLPVEKNREWSKWDTTVLPMRELVRHAWAQPLWVSEPSLKLASVDEHGLGGAVRFAFDNHFVLELSPDDLLLAIAIQVSRIVNRDPEKYRARFVDFEGKKRLTVMVDDIREIDRFIASIHAQIKNNVKGELPDALAQRFSTTTWVNGLVSRAVVMATFQNYFEYRLTIVCGIPGITLRGTHADWVALLDTVRKISEMIPEHGSWFDIIIMILNGIVNTSALREGCDTQPSEELTEFWRNIFWRKPQYGCGVMDDTFHGWILDFDAFSESGEYWPEDHSWGKEKFTVGAATIPFDIEESGKGVLVAGFMGQVIDDANRTVRAAVGTFALQYASDEGEPEIEIKNFKSSLYDLPNRYYHG